MDAPIIYQNVDASYSAIASQAQAQAVTQQQAAQYAQTACSFGYSAEELASLPSGANLGLSCGNPLATANLKSSETMLDLGSGGGLDCLIAANQMLRSVDASSAYPPTGKVIGVDRNESMIALARRNAKCTNPPLPDGLVDFIHAPITDIPLPDASVDLVVSNCVINLVPDQDKPRVFGEIYRLLKPGGRVAISDLLAKNPMPKQIRQNAALLVDCVAGASLVDDYQRWMIDAGFQADRIAFIDTKKDLNVYHDQNVAVSCCGPKQEGTCRVNSCSEKRDESVGVAKLDFNHWVASFHIYAVKGAADASLTCSIVDGDSGN